MALDGVQQAVKGMSNTAAACLCVCGIGRQLDAVMSNMQALESKLEARGINVKELGPLSYDYPTE